MNHTQPPATEQHNALWGSPQPQLRPFSLRRRACFVTRLTARALLWQALGALPYTVALDHEAGAVVVAVRGTISVNDVVTDFLATPEALDGWLPAGFLQVHCVCCTTDVEAVAWHCVWMSATVTYCCVAAGWCDCLYAPPDVKLMSMLLSLRRSTQTSARALHTRACWRQRRRCGLICRSTASSRCCIYGFPPPSVACTAA